MFIQLILRYNSHSNKTNLRVFLSINTYNLFDKRTYVLSLTPPPPSPLYTYVRFWFDSSLMHTYFMDGPYAILR